MERVWGIFGIPPEKFDLKVGEQDLLFKIKTIVGISFITLIVLFIMSTVRLEQGNYLHAGFNMLLAVVIIGGYFHLRRSLKNFKFVARVILAVAAFVAFFAIYISHENDVRASWFLIEIVMVFFWLGRTEGLIWSVSLVTLLLAASLGLPESFGLVPSEVFTLIMSAIFLMITTHWYESIKEEREYDLINAYDEMAKAALTDPLTSLPNRLSFDAILTQEVAKAQRSPSALSIIFIDLDNFKQVNDTHGHDVGDEVLRWSAGLLENVLRSSDYAARWGGEEFVVLLRETSKDLAHVVAKKICQKFQETEFPGGIRQTVSCGVTQLNPNEAKEQFIQRADSALYQVKGDGKNGVITIG